MINSMESFEDDEDSQMELIRRISSVEIIQEVTHRDTDINSDVPERRQWLQNECMKRPYLDGRYFEVDYQKSDRNGDEIVESICKMCPNEKRIRGSYNVSSNFLKHLKRVHSDELEGYKTYKRQKLDESNKEKTESTCQFSQKEFNSNLTTVFITSPSVPVSLVEQPAFKKLFTDMKIKQKGKFLKIISRRTLTDKMKQISAIHLDKIKKEISKDARFVCTTTDIWTNKIRRVLGVTVHWINSHTLERKSAAIACRRFAGTHSHARIARLLESIHLEFGLDPEKIMATVTDNGSNFVAAFKKFGISLPEDFFYEEISLNIGDGLDDDESNMSTAIGGNHISSDEVVYDDETMVHERTPDPENFEPQLPRHLRCASHTLSLIATTDALRSIEGDPDLSDMHSEAITRFTSIWNLLRSAKQRERLKEILEQALLRPVVVRWNSFYNSLCQLHCLKDKLRLVCQEFNIQSPPRESDYDYIEKYIQCLEPIAKALDFLQGDKKMYYGYLLPTLITTYRQLRSLQQQQSLRSCLPLVNALIDSLKTRFSAFFLVEKEGITAAIAAFSHPKFKYSWLHCLSEENQAKVRALIIRKANEEMETNETPSPETPVTDNDEDFFNFGDGPDDQGAVRGPLDNDPEIEVLKYSKDPRKDLTMLESYPIIKKMFLKYNTPLTASGAVERLFPFATIMDLPKFNRLTDEFFEMRVLGAANAKYEYKY